MLINKITAGFVIQTYDTDAQNWISQEFIAEDNSEYELDGGNSMNVQDFLDRVIDSKEPYLPFDMKQPEVSMIKKFSNGIIGEI